jgi:hypothetical protein
MGIIVKSKPAAMQHIKDSHQYKPAIMLDFSLRNQDVQSSQQIDNFEGEQAEEMDTIQRISMLEKFKNTI